MLDLCTISHKGGAILWSRSFTPAASKLAASAQSPINSLVREALIDGHKTDDKYEKDGYAIQWIFYNELELIFVVAYQRIIQLTYVEDLLDAMKTLFLKLFEPFLATFVASLHAFSSVPKVASESSTGMNFKKALEGWNKVFDKLLKGLEDKAASERRSRLRGIALRQTNSFSSVDDLETAPTVENDMAEDDQDISRQVSVLKGRIKGRGPGAPGRKGSRPSRVNGHGNGYGSASGNDSDTQSKRKPAKIMRKWGDVAPTESDMAALDFSGSTGEGGLSSANVKDLVDINSMGMRGKDGTYEVQDWEFTRSAEDAISQAISGASQKAIQPPKSSLGVIGSMFSRLTGGKVLTEEDIRPVLANMKEHLMQKNVAKEIADRVCDSVGQTMVGKKIGGFQSIKSTVQTALSSSITQILTPKTSTDILQSIRTKLASPLPSTAKRTPYAITFVGVNGVGKSTNLSKVCFWLLQNGFRVLIAACDTFRSGAVEQLRVHVRNLSTLTSGAHDTSQGSVELYERGYGKDAAGIAKEAIAYAKENEFDVVLIDTAGRMQDNEPLMKALAKLVASNNPDKIIFVGEALVGNEAVDQLTKFDRALRDFSSAGSGGTGSGRGIDGMLVTKWDTVDDKVGAALSMTYVTGQPIYFVGCGQTYTDLRQLRVSKVVDALLGD